MKNHRKWIIYNPHPNDWRWQCKAANGRIILASSEGYRRRTAAVENALVAGGPLMLIHRNAVSVKVSP